MSERGSLNRLTNTIIQLISTFLNYLETQKDSLNYNDQMSQSEA